MSGRQAALGGLVAVFVAGLAAVAIDSYRGNEVDEGTRERIERAWDRVFDVCDRRGQPPTAAELQSANTSVNTIIGLYRRVPNARGEFGFTTVPVSHVLETIARPASPQAPQCRRVESRAAEALKG